MQKADTFQPVREHRLRKEVEGPGALDDESVEIFHGKVADTCSIDRLGRCDRYNGSWDANHSPHEACGEAHTTIREGLVHRMVHNRSHGLVLKETARYR